MLLNNVQCLCSMLKKIKWQHNYFVMFHTRPQYFTAFQFLQLPSKTEFATVKSPINAFNSSNTIQVQMYFLIRLKSENCGIMTFTDVILFIIIWSTGVFYILILCDSLFNLFCFFNLNCVKLVISSLACVVYVFNVDEKFIIVYLLQFTISNRYWYSNRFLQIYVIYVIYLFKTILIVF